MGRLWDIAVDEAMDLSRRANINRIASVAPPGGAFPHVGHVLHKLGHSPTPDQCHQENRRALEHIAADEAIVGQ